MKLIILPRQARDNHRESTQNQTRFLTGRLREEQLWWLARLENFNQKIPRREVEVIARTVEARCKVRKPSFFEFSLCLSRACLGKISIYI